jgi:hypothetical protein
VDFVRKHHDLQRHMVLAQALREIYRLAEGHVAIVVTGDFQSCTDAFGEDS